MKGSADSDQKPVQNKKQINKQTKKPNKVETFPMLIGSEKSLDAPASCAAEGKGGASEYERLS